MEPPPIRAGIIDALCLAASGVLQHRYQADVPIADVVAEVFCTWGDFYLPESPWWTRVFDEREREALDKYGQTSSRLARLTPDGLDVAAFQLLAESRELAAAARKALVVLGVEVDDAV